MKIEIKPHKWQERGENYRSDFCVYIDGQPKRDITCEDCIYYKGENVNCEKVEEVGEKGDSKLYPFCGHICGYFELREK